MKIQCFWDVTLCHFPSGFPHFKNHSIFIFRIKQSNLSFLVDCLTVKRKMSPSFETSGATHPMTQRHISQELTLQRYHINKPKLRFKSPCWQLKTQHTRDIYELNEKFPFLLNTRLLFTSMIFLLWHRIIHNYLNVGCNGWILQHNTLISVCYLRRTDWQECVLMS
jgi:hypothetical protein